MQAKSLKLYWDIVHHFTHPPRRSLLTNSVIFQPPQPHCAVCFARWMKVQPFIAAQMSWQISTRRWTSSEIWIGSTIVVIPHFTMRQTTRCWRMSGYSLVMGLTPIWRAQWRVMRWESVVTTRAYSIVRKSEAKDLLDYAFVPISKHALIFHFCQCQR